MGRPPAGKKVEKRRGAAPRPRVRKTRLATMLIFGAAAIGVLQFHSPPEWFGKPFAAVPKAEVLPSVEVSPYAFGKSGAVNVRFVLPGEGLEYPLEVQGDPTSLAYQWVRLLDGAAVDTVLPLRGAQVVAPDRPGFYKLALLRGEERRVLDEMTLSVLVPFEEKSNGLINGYRIGTYIAERLGRQSDRPQGFIEVDAQNAGLSVSKHLRLADFLQPDGDRSWPRYVALSPELLDKLELVLAEIERVRGDGERIAVRINVHSGYRTPAYNATVRFAARDSRHQQGDAIDIAIDADGDGRFTAHDVLRVAIAVEKVERKHPDLAGGLGLYTSRRVRTPYAHIDVRGRAARWRG